jgi:hypothetical protein
VSVAVLSQTRPIEYSMLHDTTPAGPVIGTYGGVEIVEAVIDAFGRRFVYVGAAPRRPNGRFDDSALGPGEFILKPGLVYRHEKMDKAAKR